MEANHDRDFTPTHVRNIGLVEPTLTAVEMHAGALSEAAWPSLPEEMTVAMPADRRLSMAAFCGWSSQAEKNWPPPRLMLTEAKEWGARKVSSPEGM